MVLIATVVLFLVIMLTHEGSSSRFFHREEKNMKNKNHLLQSLQDQDLPSPISQKTFASHNVSPLLCRVPPSAPNPATYIPAPSISQKDLHEPQRCSFARLTEEESYAFPYAQWGGNFYPLNRSPTSTIS